VVVNKGNLSGSSESTPTEADDVEGEDRFEMFIHFGIRRSEALRDHIGVTEEMFTIAAGQVMADSRSYFLYTALDECQKAATHLMR
jgi:hypothetical protein